MKADAEGTLCVGAAGMDTARERWTGREGGLNPTDSNWTPHAVPAGEGSVCGQSESSPLLALAFSHFARDLWREHHPPAKGGPLSKTKGDSWMKQAPTHSAPSSQLLRRHLIRKIHTGMPRKPSELMTPFLLVKGRANPRRPSLPSWSPRQRLAKLRRCHFSKLLTGNFWLSVEDMQGCSLKITNSRVSGEECGECDGIC